MQKQEFLETFATATRAAKSATRNGEDDKNCPYVSRCVDAMNRLKEAPESLVCDLIITTTSIGNKNRVFVEHTNPRIRSESKLLWDLWLSYLYASGTRKIKTLPVIKNKVLTGDSKRDKVREILEKSLSKVANEVIDEDVMKKRVVACDPRDVAERVESDLFKKLGCFLGDHKAKYRSILFNIGDSNNKDLRRKVLLGEINGERLATMESVEMGSDKIQREVKSIKEKALFREENRIKMMDQSDNNNMIMT
ncbi:unnamed protein product [Cochlearia groenlandica]